MILALLACGGPPGPLTADAPERSAAVDTDPAADTAPDTAPSDSGDSGDDTAPGPVDADGDGASADVDCDDADATRFPGAVETWYDGVDQDCDGKSDDDADEDGDDARERGGGDCDDTHPYVYAGAEEWCDPVDHDCDGAPLAPGACGKRQDALALWTSAWVLPPEWIDAGVWVEGSAGDLDGDGLPELHVSCGICTRYTSGTFTYGTVAVRSGGPTGRADVFALEDEPTWFTAPGDALELSDAPVPVGDWNGDGAPDLVFSSADYGDVNGYVWVLYGPHGRFGAATPVMDAADVMWASYGGTGMAAKGYAAGDIDGDGLSDLLVGAQDAYEPYYAEVFLLPGRATASGELSLTDEPSLQLDERLAGLTNVAVLGDIDGDGADDWAAHDTHQKITRVFSGAESLVGPGTDIDDLAVERWRTEASTPSYVPLREDLDGDGLVDWLFGDHDANANGPSSGAIYVVSGMDPTRRDVHVLDFAEHYWAGAAERSYFGSQVREVATGSEMRALAGIYFEDYSAGDGYWWIAPIRALPGPAEPPPEGLRIASSNEDLLRFDLGPTVDIDGDGYDELVANDYSPTGDGSSPLGAVILPGWEIPWDDPEWW